MCSPVGWHAFSERCGHEAAGSCELQRMFWLLPLMLGGVLVQDWHAVDYAPDKELFVQRETICGLSGCCAAGTRELGV